MPAPIFIVGTERSGSNLLRLILDAHSAIALPHPPHLLHFFGPLEARYGDLRETSRLDRLVRDVLGLLQTHIHPWPRRPSAVELRRRVRDPSLVGVMIALYELWAESVEKPRWGCKSTFVIDYADDVLRACPEAKLVWLVRDPRDVAVSSKRSVFNPFHPRLTAELWDRQQRAGLRLVERLGDERIRRFHYEALLESPEGTVRAICDHIGETFEPAMLSYHASDAARRGAALCESWENTAKPILRSNHGKYRTVLTRREIELVELAASSMEELGYLRDSHDVPSLGLRERARVVLEDHALSLRVEARSARRDKNVLRRWGRAAWMQYCARKPVA